MPSRVTQKIIFDAEYARKRKQTRRERLLAEMAQELPWAELLVLIEPF